MNEKEQAYHRRLILRPGEQVVFTTVIDSNTQHAVVVGSLKDGEPVIDFRTYRTFGNVAWRCTKEGALFTLPEVAIAIRRLCALFPYVPELLVAMRLMEGRSDDPNTEPR